ncbi:MAG: bile acid:sodium symporter family protein, partial [Planctomycetota bacterium]
MQLFLNRLANLFPVWVLACAAAALWRPSLFAWFTHLIVPALGVIMLGMGVTLSVGDFARVARAPRPVLLGVAAQFTVMPLLGWAIANGLALPNEFAVGLILVACCPGGTASNVVTYIARADLALSLLMTMCSTFAAIALTPLLSKWLIGERLPVDAFGLFVSTVQVVLLPVLGGMALHHLAPRLVKRVTPIAPLVSVAAIALICG